MPTCNFLIFWTRKADFITRSFHSKWHASKLIVFKRWGDAPVHSIGAALFAKKEQLVSFPTVSDNLN